MAGKNTSAFGIYRTRGEVETAVEHLRAAGFRNTDISVLFPDNEGTKDFAHEKHTKAPEGASMGAGSGAVLGGALGWLAGIGALAIPGIGPLIAAGPIAAALAGAGAVGIAGGLVGAMVGAGIPEYEAKRYEGRIREGGILLSVHCDDADWVQRAKDILKQTGAQDISSTNEERADFAVSDKPRTRRAAGQGVEADPLLRDRSADIPDRVPAERETVVHERVVENPDPDAPGVRCERIKSDWDV